MQRDKIPENHHASRHIGRTKIDNGRVTGAAFRRREFEESISVNWLEYFGLEDWSDSLRRVTQALERKGRTVGRFSKYALINVGKMRAYVLENSEYRLNLSVLHDPEMPHDPSHSGIFNVPVDDHAIGDLIADTVHEDAVLPAKL